MQLEVGRVGGGGGGGAEGWGEGGKPVYLNMLCKALTFTTLPPYSARQIDNIFFLQTLPCKALTFTTLPPYSANGKLIILFSPGNRIWHV